MGDLYNMWIMSPYAVWKIDNNKNLCALSKEVKFSAHTTSPQNLYQTMPPQPPENIPLKLNSEVKLIANANHYRMDKQQGPTVEHRELYSISCDKP